MIPSLFESRPRRIKELVPDVTLGLDGRLARLRDESGTCVVLVFHAAYWDPARADEVASLQAPAHATTVLVRNDDPLAHAFGVTGESAVYVVNPGGEIAWRHIAGRDPVRDLSSLASAHQSISASDDRSACTRRAFVATAIGAAIAVALEPTFRRATAAAEPPPAPIGDAVPVTLNVNGKTLSLTLEPRVTLLDALREYAGLTGTKKGCDHGQCGACTVHIDGRRTLSCLTFAVMQQRTRITTIEGLATGDTLHPMQQAFIDHDGFQCGYCTSGQIMSATAVLHEPWGPGDDDVREAMSGNICRCGAYPGILAAVQNVRNNGGGQSR
jgi:xanthine dehydrogenase YagT iron-sulfur-binding subunit